MSRLFAMAVVAVAGGTGGVGKTIVERLAQESKFQVKVLSRSVSTLLCCGKVFAKLLLDTKARVSLPESSACADRLQ